MKINRIVITTLLCVGVASAADARQRHHQRHRRGAAPASATSTTLVPHHTLTPSLASATPGGLWSYNADLTSGQLAAGDGFTIFDFGGYVAGSIAAPVGWTPTTALTGSPFGTSLGLDDPALVNLTFTYNGITINQAIGAQTFTGFTANTTDLGQVADDWASHDHDITSAPATEAQGTILVPSNAVPDGGSTVALLGVALAGLEGLRRIVRTRKA